MLTLPVGVLLGGLVIAFAIGLLWGRRQGRRAVADYYSGGNAGWKRDLLRRPWTGTDSSSV